MSTSQRLGIDIVATDKTGQAFASAQKGTAKLEAAAKAAAALSKPMLDAEKNASRFSFQMQNAALQVGDFAVQVGGGTSATRALAQQLPQLLGSFGLFGAVAGAAVAIAIPLGNALLGVKDYAKEADTALKAMNDNLDVASTPLADLTDKYGNLGGEIRDVADSLAKLDASKATHALQQQAAATLEAGNAATFTTRFIDAMKGSWDDLVGGVKGGEEVFVNAFGNPEIYSESEQNLNKFRSAFGLTREVAQQFEEEYRAIQTQMKNGDFEAAAGLVSQFSGEILTSSADIQQKMLPVLQSMQDALVKAGQAALVAGQQVNELAKTDFRNESTPNETLINKVGGSDSAAAKAAARALKKEQEEAAAAARKAATEYQNFLTTIDRGVTPLQHAQEQLRKVKDEFARFQAQMTPAQQQAMAQYVSDMQANIQKLTFKEKWEEMSKGIQDATAAMAPMSSLLNDIASNIQQDFASGIADAFGAFVSGTQTAQEALQQFAASFIREITAMIAKALILYAVQKLIGMASESTTVGMFNQQFGGVYGNGGVFSGGRAVKAFASGGVVGGPTFFPMAGNGVGLMGEAGPEAIVPLSRRNGKLGVGASPVNIQIVNNSSASMRASKSPDGSIRVLVEETVADAMLRGGNKIDAALSRGYGLKRAGR